MSEATLEDRRLVADKIKAEVLAGLQEILTVCYMGYAETEGGVRFGPPWPPELVSAAARKAAVADINQEREAFHSSRSRFRRLLWLLGLSDAERAFVDAAATSAVEGRLADTHVDLAIFAEWLGDQMRHADGVTIERLRFEDGDVVIVTVPDSAGLMAPSVAFEEIGRPLQNALLKMGRRVYVRAIRKGITVGNVDAGKIQELGWVRRKDLLAHQVADRAVAAAYEQEIDRLKRENAELRRAIAAEREACAALAEAWREMPDAQPPVAPGCMTAYSEGLDCSAPQGIADAIRHRSPV